MRSTGLGSIGSVLDSGFEGCQKTGRAKVKNIPASEIMAESDLLRSIRLMKEKRDEKIATREVDPISVLDKAAESKRRVLIDKNFTGPEGDKDTKSSSASESTAPAVKNETARKEKWRAMAEQREIWDQELIEATQIAKERLQKEREEQSEISAPSAVRKKFQVLSAKEQVQRALQRSGKPDAKETPFVKRTAKKEYDLKELSQKGHVSKLFKNFDLEEEPIMPAPIVAPRTTTPQAPVKPIMQAPVADPLEEPSSSQGTCTPPPSEAAPIPFTLDEDHCGDDSSSVHSSTMNPNDVSEDAMAALTFLNNTIQDFESTDCPSTPKSKQFRELPVDGENNLLTPKSQKRSIEAEDYQNSREKLVKQHSGHLKSRGSIDDISIALSRSPHSRKLTIGDYRASQRVKDKPVRETIFNWQNQMTLKNSTAVGTLMRDAQRKDLENKISLLEQQKRQAIKAHNLIMSKTVPEDVEAEAEKCLLIATEKYNALRTIKNSMKRVLEDHSKGQIRISDLWVKANKSVIANSEHFRNTWVIGLITVGDDFFPTQMSRMDVQGEVRLLVDGSKGKRIIKNVGTDFELSISIFSLNIAKEKKEKATSGGIFSRSLFSRKSLRKNQHSGASTPVPPDTDSRFELIGRKTLRIGDVQNITSFKLEKSVMTSIFSATVTSNIKAAFTNSMEYSSFLTVKTKSSGNAGCTAYGNWIRYWARLRGDSIEFWRYPEHAETTAAEGRISLRYLLNRSIAADKRGRRPNTFELYGRAPAKNVQGNHFEGVSLSYDHNKFVRYQISADTSEEMTKWCEALGTVLQELRVWDFNMSPPVDDNC